MVLLTLQSIASNKPQSGGQFFDLNVCFVNALVCGFVIESNFAKNLKICYSFQATPFFASLDKPTKMCIM